MDTTGKVIAGIVVAIIVIGGAYYWYSSTHKNNAGTSMNASSTDTGMMAQSTSTAAANNPLPSGSNTSDASLNQDTAAIDAQMNGLSSDNANAQSSESAQ